MKSTTAVSPGEASSSVARNMAGSARSGSGGRNVGVAATVRAFMKSSLSVRMWRPPRGPGSARIPKAPVQNSPDGSGGARDRRSGDPRGWPGLPRCGNRPG